MPMKRVLVITMSLLSLWSPQAFGEEGSSQGAAAERPRLVADYSLWTGPVVEREQASLSYFGFNYREIFAGSEHAIDMMRVYPGLRIAGEITYDTSLLIILAQVALFIADYFLDDPTMEDDSGSPNGLFWGLTAGGIGLWILGDVFFAISTARVFHAVRAYNAELDR